MPASSSKDLEELEESLGYLFKNKGLLIEALTHKSYTNERPESSLRHNERLEFLGDAVLGLIISEHLYRILPQESESRLAYIKAFLVQESVLASIGEEIHLGDYLFLGKGEDQTGGRKKPSILADALEAVIGAIFLDGGLAPSRDVVLKLFLKRLEEISSPEVILDPKSELQKLTLERFGKIPEYRIVHEEGEEHRKVFTVNVYINGRFLGTGSGPSKKSAQMEAAKEALSRLLKGECLLPQSQ